MNEQLILKELKTVVNRDFKDFRNFLFMLIPKSEDDKSKINIMIDMIDSMICDVTNAETLGDLKSWFNVPKLYEDWDEVKESLSTDYSTNTLNFIQSIVENYTPESEIIPE